MADEYQIRDIDLDKLADWIREEGQLAEIPALHLLDTISVMRELNLKATVELTHSCADVKRLTAEVATLQTLVPHPGDGSCEWCGFGPTTTVNLCEECSGSKVETVQPPVQDCGCGMGEDCMRATRTVQP